jgi:hypothetical protein
MTRRRVSEPQWRLGDRFDLFEQVGAGASGTVWRGREVAAGTEHAVKLLRHEPAADADSIARLYAVLGSVARLMHPGIVAVDDAAAGDGWVALRSRLVPGESLHSLLSRHGAMIPAAATAVVAQLCDTLAAAHAVGLAHGDLHPANVLLTSGPGGAAIPTVVLTDFGMAELVNRAAVRGAGPSAPPPEYRAPELGPADDATAAADVYAVGIVLYECLTGRAPFTAQWPHEVAEMHRRYQAPPVPGLPDAQWRLLAACLEKDPRYRPGAAQLAAALRADGAPDGVVPTPAPAPVSAPAPVPTPAPMAAPVPPPAEHTRLLPRLVAEPTDETMYIPFQQQPEGRGAGDRLPRLIAEHKTESGIVAALVVVTVLIGALIGMNGGGGTAAAATGGTLAPTPAASSAAASASSVPDAVVLPSAPSTSASPSAVEPLLGPAVLVNAQSGMCLDTAGRAFTDGTTEDIYQCNGTPAQIWSLTAAGQLTQDGGAYCLDDFGLGTTPGTKVVLWSCNDGRNQQWQLQPDGSIQSVNAGLCLDVDGKSSNQGTDMVLWTCDGSASQRWNRTNG